MNQLLLIVGREVRVRLRRPSFWVLTVLVPLLLIGLYLLPVWQARRGAEPTTVLVADQSGLFDGALTSTPEVHFHAVPSLDYGQRQLSEATEPTMLLFVPRREYSLPREAFLYYSAVRPSPEVQQTVDHQLQTLLRNALLEDVYGLDPTTFHSVETTRIRLLVQDAATGREAYAEVKSAAATALAALMVVALLLFGAQVLRGVREERQTRMAEIMGATVRPALLMGGKVVGVALTALLQLGLWIALAGSGIALVRATNADLFATSTELGSLATKGEAATAQYQAAAPTLDHTLQGLQSVDFGLVVVLFLLLFFVGYLLYGLLLAAVGSRTEASAEALPTVLLVGSPLLVALALAPMVLQAPDSAVAQWLTLIPFTAPIGTLLRLPFGLPTWQVATGILLMLATAIATAALTTLHTKKR